MELQERLKELISETGVSLNSVSKSIGISASALSQWYNGTYAGNCNKVEKAIESYINNELEKREKPKFRFKFAMTTVARRIHEIARACHLKGELGVAYGNSGIGKTTALKEYVKKYPATILIETDQTCTLKTVMKMLHKKLGLDGQGNNHSLFNDCVERLKKTNRVVIIDEAEHLSYKTLEQLRRLVDFAEIGVLLVGMPRLIHNFRGLKADYEQIYNRGLGNIAKVENAKLADIEAIISANKGESTLAKSYFENSRENTRIFEKIFTKAHELSNINDCKVTEKLIRTAAEMLE